MPQQFTHHYLLSPLLNPGGARGTAGNEVLIAVSGAFAAALSSPKVVKQASQDAFGNINVPMLEAFQMQSVQADGEVWISIQDAKKPRSLVDDWPPSFWIWWRGQTFLLNGDKVQNEQYKLVTRMPRKSKQYSKTTLLGLNAQWDFELTGTEGALIQQSQMTQMNEPDKICPQSSASLFANKDMGASPLIGLCRNIRGPFRHLKDTADDLVILRPRSEGDSFSCYLDENMATCMHKPHLNTLKKHDRVSGVAWYRDRSISKATFWMASILAPLIPNISIAILMCVESLPAKLATIAALNILNSYLNISHSFYGCTENGRVCCHCCVSNTPSSKRLK